jgi:hypothetical protein
LGEDGKPHYNIVPGASFRTIDEVYKASEFFGSVRGFRFIRPRTKVNGQKIITRDIFFCECAGRYKPRSTSNGTYHTESSISYLLIRHAHFSCRLVEFKISMLCLLQHSVAASSHQDDSEDEEESPILKRRRVGSTKKVDCPVTFRVHHKGGGTYQVSDTSFNVYAHNHACRDPSIARQLTPEMKEVLHDLVEAKCSMPQVDAFLRKVLAFFISFFVLFYLSLSLTFSSLC